LRTRIKSLKLLTLNRDPQLISNRRLKVNLKLSKMRTCLLKTKLALPLLVTSLSSLLAKPAAAGSKTRSTSASVKKKKKKLASRKKPMTKQPKRRSLLRKELRRTLLTSLNWRKSRSKNATCLILVHSLFVSI